LVGILLGGGVQIAVARHERRQAAKRAARLLFGDFWLALSAVRSMAALGVWWNEQAAPPLEDWRMHREALAGSMRGSDCPTVAGGFHQVAALESWRKVGLRASDLADEARQTEKQLYAVGGILLQRGFSGGEYAELEHQYREASKSPWPQDDED